MPDLLLEAKDLSVAYAGRPALRGVSFRLLAGEMVAVAGPNGSGKSTLFRALLGHVPSSGTVRWRDKPLKKWKTRELARLVAYLPQSPGYEPGQTVLETLRLGRAPYWRALGVESVQDERIANETTDRLGLLDLLARPMDELSGGQRQRVFIGRCLAQEPAALLLDEPDSSLDLKHQVDLIRLLRTLADERRLAVAMATHDFNLAAESADRLVLLDQGAVAADAPPAEVLATPIVERVYGVPVDRLPRGPDRPPAILPVVETE